MSRVPYVMFGHSGFFGDFCDTLHALGGYLKTVAINVDDPPGTRKPIAARVEEYRRWAEAAGDPGADAELVRLDDFAPDPGSGERYMLGFRGKKLERVRDHLLERHGIRPGSMTHPTAYVSPTASVGDAVFIGAGAVVASFASLADHCFVNRGASVGHDCEVASFANLGPGVTLASSIRVGESAVVGIGATVIENLDLGEGCYVAAGAVVLKDVDPHVLVAGVPAVVKKRIH